MEILLSQALSFAVAGTVAGIAYRYYTDRTKRRKIAYDIYAALAVLAIILGYNAENVLDLLPFLNVEVILPKDGNPLGAHFAISFLTINFIKKNNG